MVALPIPTLTAVATNHYSDCSPLMVNQIISRSLISRLSLSNQARHILKCLTGCSNNVQRGSESKLDKDNDEPNLFNNGLWCDCPLVLPKFDGAMLLERREVHLPRFKLVSCIEC